MFWKHLINWNPLYVWFRQNRAAFWRLKDQSSIFISIYPRCINILTLYRICLYNIFCNINTFKKRLLEVRLSFWCQVFLEYIWVNYYIKWTPVFDVPSCLVYSIHFCCFFFGRALVAASWPIIFYFICTILIYYNINII